MECLNSIKIFLVSPCSLCSGLVFLGMEINKPTKTVKIMIIINLQLDGIHRNERFFNSIMQKEQYRNY